METPGLWHERPELISCQAHVDKFRKLLVGWLIGNLLLKPLFFYLLSISITAAYAETSAFQCQISRSLCLTNFVSSYPIHAVIEQLQR